MDGEDDWPQNRDGECDWFAKSVSGFKLSNKVVLLSSESENRWVRGGIEIILLAMAEEHENTRRLARKSKILSLR